MFTITVDTAISGHTYPVEILQFSSIEEVDAHFEGLGENPEDAKLKVINGAQEQAAKQGS